MNVDKEFSYPVCVPETYGINNCIVPYIARFLKLFFSLIILSTLLILGCTKKQLHGNQAASNIHVVATTGMVADIARNIGHDLISIDTLMGAGVDPHLYKASINDINRMNRADIILYNGLHLEGKMSDILKKFSRRKKTVALSEGIDHKSILSSEGGNMHDPHIWMDVKLWSQTLRPVMEAFMKMDPKNSLIYRRNAQVYYEQLQKLHQECLHTMAQIPKPQRVLITAHDAFRYFGRAYHVEVLGIQGISTESEAGLKEINQLVNMIAKRNIKAVFVESSISAKNIQALIEGARSRGADIKLGGELFSDAMGASGTPEGTYIGMIRHNVKTIYEGLR